MAFSLHFALCTFSKTTRSSPSLCHNFWNQHFRHLAHHLHSILWQHGRKLEWSWYHSLYARLSVSHPPPLQEGFQSNHQNVHSILGRSFSWGHSWYQLLHGSHNAFKIIEGNLTKGLLTNLLWTGLRKPAGHGKTPLLLTMFRSHYYSHAFSCSCGRGVTW